MSRIPEVTVFNRLSAAGRSRQAPANSRVEDLVGMARPKGPAREASKDQAPAAQSTWSKESAGS